MQLIVKFIDLTSCEETAKSRLDELKAPHPNPNFRKHLITFLQYTCQNLDLAKLAPLNPQIFQKFHNTVGAPFCT